MEAGILLKAVADRTRERALAALQRYELSVSELVEVLRQPQSTVSRHLRVLREAGLIRDRRYGSTVLYSVVMPQGNGSASDLAVRLLEWIEGQPLASSVESRLEVVIRRRHEMSRRFFDRVGRQWDTLREESFGSTFHLEAFIGLLPKRWIVADVGTGTGYLLPTLARHFERVIGVEPVDKMLEAARGRLGQGGVGNVKLCSGDLTRLPIPDKSIDLAVAVLVLHHVPTPRDAIEELHRIVAGGGRVLIVEQTVHDSELFHERMQDRWWGFDPGEFGRFVESIGFDEVESRRLVTVDRADDAPDLFVTTGRKPQRDEPGSE